MVSAEFLYDGLLRRGFNPAQAAALVGNMQQESSFNPDAFNSKEGATGLIQWRKGRARGLDSFAASEGRSPSDPNVQLDYIVHEMTGPESKSASAFLKAKDIRDANAALKGYIRYGDNSEPTRLQYALSFAGEQPQAPAANAVNRLAAGNAANEARNPLAGVPAARVQTVQYVPPPFSGETPNFKPLIDTTAPVARQPIAPAKPVPAPSSAGNGSNQDDNSKILKMWGLDEASPSSSSAAAHPAEDPTQATLKAWGLDQPTLDAAQASSASPAVSSAAYTPTATSDQNAASGLGKATAGSGGFVEGIPVVGPYLKSGAEKAAAEVRSWLYDTPYADELKAVQAYDRASMKAHPVARTVGNVTGAVVGTAPLAAAAPAAFGLGEGGLLARTGQAALGGAVLGGADAAVRSGGNLRDTAEGALIGGGLGAAGPTVGRAIGWTGNKLLDFVRSPTTAASAGRNMLAGLQTAGETPSDVMARISRNPNLSPMDVSDPMQMRALGIVTQPNQSGRNVLVNAVKSRIESAPVSVQTAYDTALGKTPNVKTLMEDITQTARKNAKAGFGEALKGAKPVDVGPTISTIDDIVHPGMAGKITNPGSELPLSSADRELLKIRGQLTNGTEQLTDAQKLHEIQSKLRVKADTLANSSNGQDRLAAADLRKVRQSLIDAIDTASGGKYRPAQMQYADDMSIKDAFNKGLSIFKNRSGEAGIEDRPEYWKSWFEEHSSPDERKALQQGVRVAIDQALSSVHNAVSKGAALPEIGFNKEKLAVILGPREADRIASEMADIRTMGETNNLLLRNSKTALSQEATKATAMPEPATIGPLTRTTTTGLVSAVPMKAGLAGVNAMRNAYVDARNKLIAEAISEGGAARFNGLTEKALDAQARRRLAAKGIEVGGNLLTGRGGYLPAYNALTGQP